MFFAGIRLGTDHLTGPTADAEDLENTYAEHAVARGKPVVQIIGEERIKRGFSFYFDVGWCDPEAEWARLYGLYLSKTAGALIIPGAAWRGERYLVDTLSNKKEATTESGRMVRITATIALSEDPRTAATGVLAGIFGGAVATLGRAAANIDRLR